MTYPTLPFALVSFLSDISNERSNLRKDARNITIAAHHNKSVRSSRYEVTNDSHFLEVLQGAFSLFSAGPVDTMTFLYPVDGGEPVDIGVIVERGKKPMVIEWTYAPIFKIRLIDAGPVIEQVTNGVGVKEIQALMDKGLGVEAEGLPGLTAVNPVYQTN